MSGQAVTNALARFFEAVDTCRWQDAERLMTNPFHLDYSSFGGAGPIDIDPAEVLSGWDELLPGFTQTHHQIGNLDLTTDADTTLVRCYVTGTHVIEERVWTVVGAYRIRLVQVEEGWRLASIRFLYRYQTGATDLVAEAQERAVNQDQRRTAV